MGRQTLPLVLVLLYVGLLSFGLPSFGLARPADHSSRRSHGGRLLIEALEDLRTQGLDLIYSSDLIRRDMHVLAEPVAATPRGMLEDLIAPYGLVTRDGPGGTILIVPGDPDAGAAGTTGGIAGRVTGGGSGTPASGAVVSVPGTTITVLTVLDGRFLIPRLPPGRWPLDVRSADGSTQQTIDVPVKAGEMTRVSIELSPAPNVIEEIVVTPTQYKITGETPETRSSVQAEELSRLAHLGDDAQRAAARLPGAASGDKSARFSLRGGEWNEVLVVLDGLEIDQPFHLKEFLAFSGIVDSQAMSGVMELSSSTPPEQPSTSIGTGLPNSRVLMQGRTHEDAARWLVAARAWYPDAVLDLVDPGGEDINPYYYDLLGKIEFHPDTSWPRGIRSISPGTPTWRRPARGTTHPTRGSTSARPGRRGCSP